MISKKSSFLPLVLLSVLLLLSFNHQFAWGKKLSKEEILPESSSSRSVQTVPPPGCEVDYPYDYADGWCDYEYNTEVCEWDGGDCLDHNDEPLPPGCTVLFPSSIGDGFCDGVDYNTEVCEWDGGDCDNFNEMYPGCTADMPARIGDGYCHGGDYNTEECGWDGGDCDEFNEMYPNCIVLSPYRIGDGSCDPNNYNTEECGWDGGDCDLYNSYPDCDVPIPASIGDGECDGIFRRRKTGGNPAYNTEECGWDGGDCDETNKRLCERFGINCDQYQHFQQSMFQRVIIIICLFFSNVSRVNEL